MQSTGREAAESRLRSDDRRETIASTTTSALGACGRRSGGSEQRAHPTRINIISVLRFARAARRAVAPPSGWFKRTRHQDAADVVRPTNQPTSRPPARPSQHHHRQTGSSPLSFSRPTHRSLRHKISCRPACDFHHRRQAAAAASQPARPYYARSRRNRNENRSVGRRQPVFVVVNRTCRRAAAAAERRARARKEGARGGRARSFLPSGPGRQAVGDDPAAGAQNSRSRATTSSIGALPAHNDGAKTRRGLQRARLRCALVRMVGKARTDGAKTPLPRRYSTASKRPAPHTHPSLSPHPPHRHTVRRWRSTKAPAIEPPDRTQPTKRASSATRHPLAVKQGDASESPGSTPPNSTDSSWRRGQSSHRRRKRTIRPAILPHCPAAPPT
uniref:Uncharacterized protein n=1 Tax=Plectus sambesii TaxID=2011161 RepID=A0A914V054_9BILA